MQVESGRAAVEGGGERGGCLCTLQGLGIGASSFVNRKR
jgi:hypothetical protein